MLLLGQHLSDLGLAFFPKKAAESVRSVSLRVRTRLRCRMWRATCVNPWFGRSNASAGILFLCFAARLQSSNSIFCLPGLTRERGPETCGTSLAWNYGKQGNGCQCSRPVGGGTGSRWSGQEFRAETTPCFQARKYLSRLLSFYRYLHN